MRSTAGLLVAALAALLSGPVPVRAQEAIDGRWEGGIDVAGQRLEFAVSFESGAELAAYIDIQGATGLPLESVSYADGAVHFEITTGPGVAVWEGKREGDRITGTFAQGGVEGTFALTRTGEAVALGPAPTLTLEPAAVAMNVGESVTVGARLTDAAGGEVEGNFFWLSSQPQALVASDGRLEAKRGGEFEVRVFAQTESGRMVRGALPVRVSWPPATGVELGGLPARLEAGNSYRIAPRIALEGGLYRTDLPPTLSSSDPAVLSVGAAGSLRALKPGRATVTASAEGVSDRWTLEVSPSPVRSVEVATERTRARTGDVLRLRAVARDQRGSEVSGAPIAWSVQAFPIDTLVAPPAAAHVFADGAFVAEKPGAYTVYATSGGVSGAIELYIAGREVREEVELVGHGSVGDVHTSDLWVWEAADGRDYAVTGTWGGEGKAYFWDVTDPARIVKVDSVQVDARTVNDVKVSEDGRIAVISREGASNRRNGIVILDVTNPRDVQQLSVFDEGLTGGVHNVFIHDGHVYALSAGQRYDIIDIADPRNPRKVGSFELDAPGRAIHDVWVVDGIAYSSNWRDGVVLVDVGNGVASGSPSNPVKIGQYAYPSGANHAAFPWKSESTGTFYVIAGDEIMAECVNPDRPCRTQGYIHFIDFSDRENPVEVARYQVPEAGTHNLWVEGDRLYVAYYNGGLRVVDISGELRGDLYRQGREIVSYLAYDGEGKVPNAPMAWGPQPHKGHVFFSDWNSGLWAVRLKPSRTLVP